MSTNSLVAYMDEDWKVTTSYIHYDGYIRGVGERLLETYNNKEKAYELATSLGYASSLEKSIEDSHADRGNDHEPITNENYFEFEEYIKESSHLEYVYVWVASKNEWQVATWDCTELHTLSEKGCDFRYDWNGFEDLNSVFIRDIS